MRSELLKFLSPAVFDMGGVDYASLKKAAENASETAAKSGSATHRMAAAAAHSAAAEKAPSDEEKKAHLDCAASHLHQSANAVRQEGMTDGQRAAAEIKQTARKTEEKHGGYSHYMSRVAALASPATLAPEAPALSLLAFSGTGFVPVPIDPNGPNNVGSVKDGPNPAGPKALSSVKDVLSAGSYKHPVHGWSLDVTPKKMAQYCAAFSEMKNAGVKVPIYADHKPGAATTLGYCRDMFMGGPEALKKYPELAKLPADQAPTDPNRMYAIHDWNSPESMKMGHGVGQVSVLIDKRMKDGTGKSYGEAVRHIAVTPEPVVPNQGAFTQLAASLLVDCIGLYACASKP